MEKKNFNLYPSNEFKKLVDNLNIPFYIAGDHGWKYYIIYLGNYTETKYTIDDIKNYFYFLNKIPDQLYDYYLIGNEGR